MTVKELIEKLQKIDPKAKVFLDDGFSEKMLELKSVYMFIDSTTVVVTMEELTEADKENNLIYPFEIL